MQSVKKLLTTQGFHWSSKSNGAEQGQDIQLTTTLTIHPKSCRNHTEQNPTFGTGMVHCAPLDIGRELTSKLGLLQVLGLRKKLADISVQPRHALAVPMEQVEIRTHLASHFQTVMEPSGQNVVLRTV